MHSHVRPKCAYEEVSPEIAKKYGVSPEVQSEPQFPGHPIAAGDPAIRSMVQMVLSSPMPRIVTTIVTIVTTICFAAIFMDTQAPADVAGLEAELHNVLCVQN